MIKPTDLKELHSDTGEHELEQRCDDHDVPDGPDGHKHTLDHVLLRGNDQMFRYKLSTGGLDKDKSDFNVCDLKYLGPWTSTHLQSFGSIDGSEGPQHPQHTQNLHD